MNETCVAVDADRRWTEDEDVSVGDGSDVDEDDVADMNEGFGGTAGGG
jgi:hypothetical protein